MKIEIGESLIDSYLRHVKRCLLVQTNWKSSSYWQTDPTNQSKVAYLYETINRHQEFQNIFPSQLSQTIQQAEIDVIGIDNTQTIYAYEIAFHENGLNYGSKEHTKNRVFKKLFRNFLTLQYYFPKHQYHIAFCSPKVHNATEQIIKEYFSILTEMFAHHPNVTFHYISNQKFYTKIVTPTVKKTKREADSSELFVRSIKLLNLGEQFKQHETEEKPLHHDCGTESETTDIPQKDTVKIKHVTIRTQPLQGESVQDFVKYLMRRLINQNLLPQEELRNLQEKNYSMQTFGIQFPLLLPTTQSPQDKAGHTRYWTREIFGDYYVCKEWWRDHFDEYLINIKNWLLYLERTYNINQEVCSVCK